MFDTLRRQRAAAIGKIMGSIRTAERLLDNAPGPCEITVFSVLWHLQSDPSFAGSIWREGPRRDRCNGGVRPPEH